MHRWIYKVLTWKRLVLKHLAQVGPDGDRSVLRQRAVLLASGRVDFEAAAGIAAALRSLNAFELGTVLPKGATGSELHRLRLGSLLDSSKQICSLELIESCCSITVQIRSSAPLSFLDPLGLFSVTHQVRRLVRGNDALRPGCGAFGGFVFAAGPGRAAVCWRSLAQSNSRSAWGFRAGLRTRKL